MPETSGSGRRLFRRFALGSGPLKRGTDRLQLVARLLLLITVLTAIPVALAVVTANYSQGLTVAAAEAAERHQVTATLLADAARVEGRRPAPMPRPRRSPGPRPPGPLARTSSPSPGTRRPDRRSASGSTARAT